MNQTGVQFILIVLTKLNLSLFHFIGNLYIFSLISTTDIYSIRISSFSVTLEIIMTSLIKAITSLHTISLVLQLIHQTLCDTSDNVCLDLHNYNYSIQLTLVISNSMGPWKTFESTVVRLMRSYEDTGSVVCLTTKGRQLERNFEELKPASHVPILGTILNIFDVFVAVLFSPLNSLNLVKRLITSRYIFLCE